MNKAQLIENISQKANISKIQAELAIDTLTQTITETIKKGEEVTITGFGSFSARKRKGRTGVNPRNPQEKIEIAPVLVAKFKAGKVLKNALKGKTTSQPAPATTIVPESSAPAESTPTPQTPPSPQPTAPTPKADNPLSAPPQKPPTA